MINREWEKSFASEPNGGSCVEVDKSQPGEIAVRDDKLGEASPILIFDYAEWSAFLIAVKAGQFDLPDDNDAQELITRLRNLSPEQREQLWYLLEDAKTLEDPALQQGLAEMRAGKVVEA
jgi:hypothetical protein